MYARSFDRQDRYLTVAEALQAAVLSLLKDEDMRYKQSFYYWAAFFCHGFASVKLDDALLREIHARLQALRQEPSQSEQSTLPLFSHGEKKHR